MKTNQKKETKMLTISKKIEKLEYAKRNLDGEYNDLMKKHSLKDIMQRNHPLEEALIVSIDAIERVLESLEEERK